MDGFSTNSDGGLLSNGSCRKSQPKSVFAVLRRKLSPKTKSGSEDARRLSDSDCSDASSDLQMVFDYFDGNGDGKISAEELQRCVRAVGGQLSMDEAQLAIESSDSDGDGMLGFHEFQELIEGTGSTVEEKNKELREAFNVYVMDGSSCITATSLKKVLNRLGESKSTKDCKAMIRAFDLNGDGVLSFDEFAVMMR